MGYLRREKLLKLISLIYQLFVIRFSGEDFPAITQCNLQNKKLKKLIIENQKVQNFFLSESFEKAIYQLQAFLATIINRDFVHDFRNKLTVLYFLQDNPLEYKKELIKIIFWLYILYGLLFDKDILYFMNYHNYYPKIIKTIPLDFLPFVGLILLTQGSDIVLKMKNNFIVCEKIIQNKLFKQFIDGLKEYSYYFIGHETIVVKIIVN